MQLSSSQRRPFISCFVLLVNSLTLSRNCFLISLKYGPINTQLPSTSKRKENNYYNLRWFREVLSLEIFSNSIVFKSTLLILAKERSQWHACLLLLFIKKPIKSHVDFYWQICFTVTIRAHNYYYIWLEVVLFFQQFIQFIIILGNSLLISVWMVILKCMWQEHFYFVFGWLGLCMKRIENWKYLQNPQISA